MSGGASARSRVALTTLFGAWLASCSADVDGYHLRQNPLVNNGGSTSEAGSAGAVGGGAGTTNSGAGGGSGASNGGAGGIKTFFPPDAGPDTSLGAGGAEGGAAGAADTGGADNGGTGSGGVVTGGTGNGGTGTGGAGTGGTGTGGKGAGGAGTGGTGAGGAGTGGTGTGGTGTGGTGTGGTGTGGTGSGGAGTVGSSDPVWMGTSQSISGITAAAWVGSQNKFYLLEPANHQFWSANVSTDPAVIGGPFALPASGTVASFAFGASATTVYVVISNSIYRVPVTGNASATPVVGLGDNPLNTALTGAYANGWFLLGESTGATHALQDAQTTLNNSVSLKNLNFVSTDGSSFVFRTIGIVNSANHSVLYQMPATAPLTPSATPCDTGAVANEGQPSGVFGDSVTWVLPPASGSYQLHSGTFASGVCTASSQPLLYGTVPDGGQFSGMVDSQYVLVASSIANRIGTITLMKLGGGFAPRSVPNVYFGNKFPTSFVMGPPHHAAVLSGDVPALISY